MGVTCNKAYERRHGTNVVRVHHPAQPTTPLNPIRMQQRNKRMSDSRAQQRSPRNLYGATSADAKREPGKVLRSTQLGVQQSCWDPSGLKACT